MEGKATAYKDDIEVLSYKVNDFFGELALLNNSPRQATIKTTSDLIKLVSIDWGSFKRLLGPIENILERQKENYI